MRIDIYHNLLWSRYKGAVFTELYGITREEVHNIRVIHIAETESERSSLTPVDRAYHQYPFELIFEGAYDKIPLYKLCGKLLLSVLKSDADVVVLPGYHRVEYWLMLFLLKFKRIKILVFCDSTAFDKPSSYIKDMFKGWFFKRCHGFFVYGRRASDYVASYGISAERIFVRNQAHAKPLCYNIDDVIRLRRLYRKNNDTFRILYVGRLSQEKSVDLLLDAFKKVSREIAFPKLVIVGDGNLRRELESYSTVLNLGTSVVFTGSMGLEELAVEYMKATCLVLPSHSEPWGLVVNEALSYGCPVVVSNRCGCVPELVENTETGLVFQSQDSDDLALKLISAPIKFANTEDIQRKCLDLISEFTPIRSAKSILRGCVETFNRTH